MKIVLILDESGAKGYSNNAESVPGELGVMAGYLISYEQFDSIKNDLDAIRANYLVEGKVHITDLDPEQQKSLRCSIFELFIKAQIPWIYEATYVQGFYEHAEYMEEIHQDAKQSRKSNIKVSGNKKYELLHAELFLGIFGKALALCEDSGLSDFDVEIITDRTDTEILRKFEQSADDILNFGQKRAHKVTGYDPDKKQVVEGIFTIQMVDVEGKLGDYSGITYSIRCEDNSLTLAADVLVNSVYYHLKQFQKTHVGIPLNKTEAISGHPLQSLVYGTHDDPESNYIPDAMYMHPEEKINYPKK